MSYTIAGMRVFSRPVRHIHRIALVLPALLLLSIGISSQEIEWSRLLVPGILIPEDEEAFFEYDIDDVEVSLLMSGSWHVTSGIGLGFRMQPEAYGSPFLFGTRQSGFSPSPLKNQVETITSVWIENRYFVSTEIHDNAEPKTLIAGYRGSTDEILQSAIIGYGQYPFPFYPGLSPDTGEHSVPGLMLHFTAPEWENHIRLTLHEGGWSERYFTGHGEIYPEFLPLSQPLDPVEFLLPDEDIDTSSLIVWVEDPDGPITAESSSGASGPNNHQLKVRRGVAGEDYHWDSARGVLESRVPGAILVYYTSSELNIGDSMLGQDAVYDYFSTGWPQISPADLPPEIDFAWNGSDWTDFLNSIGLDESQFQYQVQGHASDVLMLHYPGRYSPFARYNRFPTTMEIDTEQVLSGYITPGPTPTQLLFTNENEALTVSWIGASTRHPAWRFPLFWFPDVLTGGSGEVLPELTLLPQGSTPDETTSMILPGDTVPGSLQIFRNGQPSTSYRYEDHSGELILFPSPMPDEFIYVRFYRTGDNGNPLLQLRSGIQGSFDDQIDWSVSQQGFWGIATQASDEAQPRNTRLHGSLQQRTEHSTWELHSRLQMSSLAPDKDATLLKWEGLQRAGFTPQGVRIAAPPQRIFNISSIDESRILSQDTRGELRYRYKPRLQGDYLEYSVFDPDQVDIQSGYRVPDNGFTGPYLARPSIDGQAHAEPMVFLEYALDETDQWTGAQLMHADFTDFSRADAIQLKGYLRTPADMPPDPEVRIVLQFGRLDEDIDDDGVLDRGTRGIPFTVDGRTLLSSHHGALAQIASQQGAISEDWNDSGNLSYGTTPRQWATELSIDITGQIMPSGTGDGEWQTINLDFAQLPAAARTQLRNADGIRVIVVRENNGNTELAGLLGIGDWMISRAPIQSVTPGISYMVGKETLTVSVDRSEQPVGPYVITGPLSASWNQYGDEAEISITGDEQQTVHGTFTIFDTDGRASSQSFSVEPGDNVKLLFPISGNTSRLHSYRIELEPADSSDFSIKISEPRLQGSRTGVSAEFYGMYDFYLPDTRIIGPVHSPHGELSAEFDTSSLIDSAHHDMSSRLSLSGGIGIANLYLQAGARAAAADQFRLQEIQHTLAYPLRESREDLHIPRIGTPAARSPAAAGKLASGPGLQFIDSYAVSGNTAENRRRRTFLWAQLNDGSRPLFLAGGSDGRLSAEMLRQDWQWYAGIGPVAAPFFGMETVWNTVSQNSVPPLPYEQYGITFAEDYRLLVPNTERPVSQRIIRHKIESSLGTSKSAGSTAAMEMINSAFADPDSAGLNQRSTAWDIDLQLHTGMMGTYDTQLLYGHSRHFTIMRPEHSAPIQYGWLGFAENTAVGLDLSAPYSEYILRIPGYDLFAETPLQRKSGDSQAVADYQHKLEIARAPFTDIADIWIPQAVQLELSRRLSSSPDSQIDRTTAEISLRNRATNIFGGLGSHGYFTWYDIDDYIAVLRVSHTRPEHEVRINPRAHSQFSRPGSMELHLDAEWDSRLSIKTEAHDWRSSIGSGLRVYRDIETTYDLIPAAALQQGPDLSLQMDSDSGTWTSSLLLGYHVSIQNESHIHAGGDLQLGISRQKVNDIAGTFWDFGLTGSVFAIITW